jgi:hypothetical protein
MGVSFAARVWVYQYLIVSILGCWHVGFRVSGLGHGGNRAEVCGLLGLGLGVWVSGLRYIDIGAEEMGLLMLL